MSNEKFFKPDGTEFEFSVETFIADYQDDYYTEEAEKRLVSPLNRSSKYVEGVIEDILAKGKTNERYDHQDFARILAWKIGYIDHENSESSFVYKEDWKDLEERAKDTNGAVKRDFRSKTEDFPIGKIVSYLVKNQDVLKDLAQKEDPKDFFDNLRKQPFFGLGTVYIITLLYFLSGEQYPIYDRYAHKAAKAIIFDKRPIDVYVGDAPSKTSVNDAMKLYSEYRWLLTQIFGSSHINRDQDRALWVYGHSKTKYPDCVMTE